MSSLAAANWGLQRKVDAADADITEMKVSLRYLQYLVVYRGDYHQNVCALSYTHNLVVTKRYMCMTSLAVQN